MVTGKLPNKMDAEIFLFNRSFPGSVNSIVEVFPGDPLVEDVSTMIFTMILYQLQNVVTLPERKA